MIVASNLCALLAVVSLANALPLPRKSNFIFRSSSLQNVALVGESHPDMFTSRAAPLPRPKILAREVDLSDVTSPGIDNNPILYDSPDAWSDLQQTTDGPYKSAQVADSTAYLCLDNCYAADLSIPVGSDLPPLVEDPGNIFFEEATGLDGLSIPWDEEAGSGPGTWIEVHQGSGWTADRGSGWTAERGSGRDHERGSFSSIT